ncbi:hypothetical protein EOL94_02935 [bacterium]|nr:hypothetical protein [bacterium]
MNDNVTIFAETNFRNSYREFGIKTDDRRRHMYFIGKTGMGKSTVLENMIISDIRAGNGVAVVDPHGDLAEKVIEFIPDHRIKDVVYFNPSDMHYPIAFNVVEQVEPHLRHLVASGLIGVFKKLWADSWGPRLEYILRNAILAILDYPDSTLLGVVRMLSDKDYRKNVVSNVQDPVVKAFWEKEFSGYADKFAAEAVSPIQNKVGQFLSSSLMRNIVGQVKSSIDLREIMDNGKILIMNLSKGRIGEDNSALLGAMMITKIQLAAMSRVDINESERKDFYLYIDEFQNFSTESFANILSEARKYRLNLIMAHQYIEQLGDTVKAAVFGNVGTLVVFRVGAGDAEELVKEFAPTFDEEDIVNLPKYEMYLKLMIDGIASSPFSARGLLPLNKEEKTHNVEKVIEYSRKNYANERESVEKDIMESMDTGPVVSNGKESRKKSSDNLIETKCSRCGKKTYVSFKPDGVRPVYCKDCLSLPKEEKDNIKRKDNLNNGSSLGKNIDNRVKNLNQIKDRSIIQIKKSYLKDNRDEAIDNKAINKNNNRGLFDNEEVEEEIEEPKEFLSLNNLKDKKVFDFKGRPQKVDKDFSNNKNNFQESSGTLEENKEVDLLD